ncbi:pilus assembly protein TadG-related protein [Pelotomaculum propionicicum]|uniref:pilus assembly protein TadG-related protein n=1 Tax=Pelotomaculum propionicicum TaxID=258475 RepID=UPI003B805179
MKKFVTNEDGQVLILFALALVVLMGFAALAVDVGSMTLTRTKLQSAADASALAGAHDLPDESTAENTAVTYAGKNGVQESDTIATAGYDGDPNKIEVVCKRKVSHTFARIIGFTNTDISARAVAQKKGFNGGTLPFINWDPYEKGEEIEIWDKEGKGNKERLNTPAHVVMYQYDPEIGAVHGNGKMANVKDEVGDICPDGATVYLLSLSNDVMIPGTTIPTITKNGKPGSFVYPDGNVGQETRIPSEYIVLLKCTVRHYDDKTAKVIVEEVYEDLTSVDDFENIDSSPALVE